MPIRLPNLDDVTWEQFNEEARSIIPGYAPEWTNFNASDPGITLLELLAYFNEILLFRTNQITDEQTELFLRLLNGPAWKPRESLEEERRSTLLSFEKPLRAVTPGDFEGLAIAATDASSSGRVPLSPEHRVARAKCICDRNLEESRDKPAPGHISLVILTHKNPVPSASTLRRVKRVLDEARLITTRVHVVPPSFVTFGVRLTLEIGNEVSVDWIRTAATNRLEDYFDPFRGGADHEGWPFGRSIYVSELYQVLSKIPGVGYVTQTSDPDTHDEQDQIQIDPSDEWRKQLNGSGDLEAVEIREYELVKLELKPEHITVRRRGRVS